MGTGIDTSVSQVTTAKRCMRKWAFGSIYHDYEPQTQDASEGEELHMHHQLWFQNGLKYDAATPLGLLASKGLPFLPDRLLDDPVSEAVINVTVGAHTYRKNKIDLHWNSPAGPCVADYKKAKDEATMRRFGLNKQTLRADLQANLYGYWVMKKFGYDFVHLRWLYHLVKEVEVVPVDLVLDLADAKQVLNLNNVVIDNMAYLKHKKLPILEIEGNEDACEDYSGCTHYAPKCGVTLRERKPRS